MHDQMTSYDGDLLKYVLLNQMHTKGCIYQTAKSDI